MSIGTFLVIMGKISWKCFLLLLLSCNQIESSNTRDQDDIEYIKGLRLLDEGENHPYVLQSVSEKVCR